MATLKVQIEPLEVPKTVVVKVGTQYIEVPVKDLSPEEVEELANDFVAALLAQVAEGPAE
jgi:capsular polysaccharide biosynthesis protein